MAFVFTFTRYNIETGAPEGKVFCRFAKDPSFEQILEHVYSVSPKTKDSVGYVYYGINDEDEGKDVNLANFTIDNGKNYMAMDEEGGVHMFATNPWIDLADICEFGPIEEMVTPDMEVSFIEVDEDNEIVDGGHANQISSIESIDSFLEVEENLA